MHGAAPGAVAAISVWVILFCTAPWICPLSWVSGPVAGAAFLWKELGWPRLLLPGRDFQVVIPPLSIEAEQLWNQAGHPTVQKQIFPHTGGTVWIFKNFYYLGAYHLYERT